MKSQQQARDQSRKVLTFGSKVLASTAREMRRHKSPQKRFAAMAAGLNGLQPKLSALHPRASAGLTDGAALAAGQIASALTGLRQAKRESARFDSAAGVVAGLEQMSTVVVAIADSLASERCCASPDDPELRSLLEQVARFQVEAGDAAFGLHQAAAEIGQAIALFGSLSSRSFSFPAVAGSCGRGAGPGPTQTMDVAAPWAVGAAYRAGIDDAALAESLSLLDGAADALSSLLSGLAALLVLLFLLDCPQPCGPPDNAYIGPAAAPGIPTLAAVGATPAGAGTVQPWFDVDWSYCCLRPCLVFLSRTCIQTVTTRHNAGAPLAPMFAAIVARARGIGTAAIAFYKAGAPAVPGAVPPLTLPAAPVCTC